MFPFAKQSRETVPPVTTFFLLQIYQPPSELGRKQKSLFAPFSSLPLAHSQPIIHPVNVFPLSVIGKNQTTTSQMRLRNNVDALSTTQSEMNTLHASRPLLDRVLDDVILKRLPPLAKTGHRSSSKLSRGKKVPLTHDRPRDAGKKKEKESEESLFL